jgi:uncharacterized protein YndB with AHSA1/START domain
MGTAIAEPALSATNGHARATLSLEGDRGIHIEREFNAPRKRVWRAMTKRKLLQKWWGRGNKLEVEKLDFEPGGHWRFVEKSADSEDGFEGRFGEIQKPERIVQTFEWDGMPAHTALQTLTFEKIDDDHTKVTCDVVCFSKAARDGMVRSGMEEGMNQSYDALDKVLKKMD